MSDRTPMATLERSFLALEHDGLPMHIAALMILEGEAITAAELRRLVRSRLHRLPRFRQLAATGMVRSEWLRIERVDLAAHVLQHQLPPPGSLRQLLALCASIHEARLVRDEPLWQIHLVDGLSGGRQALLVKTHHAITDGLGGIEVGHLLFGSPADKAVHVAPSRFCGVPVSPAWAALQGMLGLGYTAAAGPIATQGPFNGRVGPGRSFGAASLRMSTLRGIKHEFGVTVDDVVLSLVAVGLRRYLHEIGYPHVPQALRAMIPVSTRAPGQPVAPGNSVTAMFVDLPLGADDLAGVISRITKTKSTLRSAHVAAGGSMLVDAVGALPNVLHSLVLGAVGSLTFANLVVSDVRGPAEPVSVLGRRVKVCYPMMPLASSVGLAIATLSVGNVMGIGVTADPGLVPDAQRIARSIEGALAHQARRSDAHAA